MQKLIEHHETFKKGLFLLKHDRLIDGQKMYRPDTHMS